MAQWYVDSTATGTGAGTSWANACVSCSALLALATPPVAGDQINIYNGSAESYSATTTLTFPGTPASPNIIVGCNKLASPPASANLVPASGVQTPSLTGVASITTTGASALTLAGSFFMRGVNLNCGTGTTAANMTLGSASGSDQRYELCYFSLGTTATTSAILLGGGGAGRGRYLECGYSFSQASQHLVPNHTGFYSVRNGLLNTSGTLPTTLWVPGSSRSGITTMDGLDTSALGAGHTLYQVGATGTRQGARCIMKNLNLNSAVALCSVGANVSHGEVVEVIAGPLGPWDYRKYSIEGTLAASITQYRNGGQTDGSGNPLGWYLTTTSNATWTWPFEIPDMVSYIPASQVGALHTATVYFVSGQNQLSNADIWFEIYFMGTSGAYMDSLVTNAIADPFAANNGGWPIDAVSSWNSGIVSPFNQYMTATFTPQVAGLYNLRCKMARSSPALLIDPAVYIT